MAQGLSKRKRGVPSRSIISLNAVKGEAPVLPSTKRQALEPIGQHAKGIRSPPSSPPAVTEEARAFWLAGTQQLLHQQQQQLLQQQQQQQLQQQQHHHQVLPRMAMRYLESLQSKDLSATAMPSQSLLHVTSAPTLTLPLRCSGSDLELGSSNRTGAGSGIHCAEFEPSKWHAGHGSLGTGLSARARALLASHGIAPRGEVFEKKQDPMTSVEKAGSRLGALPGTDEATLGVRKISSQPTLFGRHSRLRAQLPCSLAFIDLTEAGNSTTSHDVKAPTSKKMESIHLDLNNASPAAVLDNMNQNNPQSCAEWFSKLQPEGRSSTLHWRSWTESNLAEKLGQTPTAAETWTRDFNAHLLPASEFLTSQNSVGTVDTQRPSPAEDQSAESYSFSDRKPRDADRSRSMGPSACHEQPLKLFGVDLMATPRLAL